MAETQLYHDSQACVTYSCQDAQISLSGGFCPTVSIVWHWKRRQCASLSQQTHPDSGRSCEEPCQHVCVTIRVCDTGCAQWTGRKCPRQLYSLLRENCKIHILPERKSTRQIYKGHFNTVYFTFCALKDEYTHFS